MSGINKIKTQIKNLNLLNKKTRNLLDTVDHMHIMNGKKIKLTVKKIENDKTMYKFSCNINGKEYITGDIIDYSNNNFKKLWSDYEFKVYRPQEKKKLKKDVKKYVKKYKKNKRLKLKPQYQ